MKFRNGILYYTEDGHLARFWHDPMKAIQSIKRFRRKLKNNKDEGMQT